MVYNCFIFRTAVVVQIKAGKHILYVIKNKVLRPDINTYLMF